MTIRTRLKVAVSILILGSFSLSMTFLFSAQSNAKPATTDLLISQSFFSLLIALLLAAVAVAVYLFNRSMFRRLTSLRGAAMEVVSGNGNYDIDQDKDDEIGELAKIFETAFKKWKTAASVARGLEQLLEDRTAKLLKTNERLNREVVVRKKAENIISERLKFEQLSFEVVSDVITKHDEELDTSIIRALHRIRLFFDADAVFLGKISHDGKLLPSSHVCVSKHFNRDRYLKLARTGSYPTYASHLLRAGFFVWGRPEEFPDWHKERKFFSALGIKATAIVMLHSDGTAMHTIGVDSLRHERKWPDNIEDRLRFIGKMLYNALERRYAEAELKNNERTFRMLVKQAAESFFVLDYTGKISDVNYRACESLGFSREELLDMTIADVDIEVESKRHKELYWERLEPGNYIPFEGMHRRKDGTTFPVSVRLGRVDIGDKRSLLALVRDISSRKSREEELEKAFQEIKVLKDQLEQENISLRKELEAEYHHGDIVGKSDPIRNVIAQANRVAKSDACVLILGETGTGKEVMAHFIHYMSERKSRAMIKVNCAALPATLIESELFGREKGAYTGASTSQMGRFEAASGSTIFLDEIGDLPMEMQVKLLRVLQDGQFERLGSMTTISTDARVIAATNRDLSRFVRDGRFRSDLYYRLNVFPIIIPPLRDRKEDIPLLVREFINEFNQKRNKPVDVIPKRTMELLGSYGWPGNIRELRNVIERAMLLSPGSTLYIDRLETEDSAANTSGKSEPVRLDEVNRKHIVRILERTDWRIYGKMGAAKMLGLKPSTLQYKIKKLRIEKPSLN